MHEFNSKSPSLCELQQVVTKPICTKLICFDHRQSSCASTSTLDRTHLRLLLVDHAGSASPTLLVVIIANNNLHPQTPSRRRHHRPWSSSTPTKSSFSPTSDAAQLQSENPGLIPDNFYHYN
jgi:hypothetical protein